jgi:hypothetical protein
MYTLKISGQVEKHTSPNMRINVTEMRIAPHVFKSLFRNIGSAWLDNDINRKSETSSLIIDCLCMVRRPFWKITESVHQIANFVVYISLEIRNWCGQMMTIPPLQVHSLSTRCKVANAGSWPPVEFWLQQQNPDSYNLMMMMRQNKCKIYN